MSQNQSSATACRLCELSGQFNCDSKKEDPIEKVLDIIKAVYLPWGEQPVRCEDLKSHELWEKLSMIVRHDWSTPSTNVTNLGGIKHDTDGSKAEEHVVEAMR